MIRYVVKNNAKLMFRSKWIIVLIIAAPIFTIAILSSAFSTLLKSYEGVDEFTTGYDMESGSIFETAEDIVKEAGKEAGITFVRYQEGNPQELMNKNDLACYIEFGQNSYTIYESDNHKVEGFTMEYFLNKVMDEYEKQALAAITGKTEEEEPDITLPTMSISYMPVVDSTNYYGIVYIVYFSCCGIVCAAGILANEKKYGIGRKYRVSPLSEWKLYLCRLVPVVIVMTVGMFITTLLSILMFGIHWGNYLLSAFIIFLVVLAGTTFGYMLYYLTRNMAITVVILFTTTWFMGYFGGSFETYMYASSSDLLKNLSPIYHADRALVEISCMGHSTYTESCILYLLGITILCSVTALIVTVLRREKRA